MKLLVAIVGFVLVSSTNGKSVNGCDNEDCLDAAAFCRECLAQRSGREYFANPFHCSKYFQCSEAADGTITATGKRCAPCTYWSDDVVTCVRYENAKCPSGVSPIVKQAISGGCSKYAVCTNPITQMCCMPGYGFIEAAQQCQQNGCNDTCQDVETTTSVQMATTTGQAVIKETCVLNGWTREMIKDDPYSYWLLFGGTRYRKFTCLNGKKFDVASCLCEKACLKFWASFDTDSSMDKFNNYFDKGTTEISNGTAHFDEVKTSSIEIPMYKNSDYGMKRSLALWFNSKGGDGELAAIATNGDCSNNGSVNVWIYGNTVKAGFATTSTPVEDSFIETQAQRNEWHFIALSYDGAMVSFYVDNVLVGTKAQTGDILKTQASLTFGSQFCFSHNNKFTGYMDEIRIFSCPLSKDQVNDLYLKGYSDGSLTEKN